MPSTLDTWKQVLQWLVRSHQLAPAGFARVPERLTALYPPALGFESVKQALLQPQGSLGEPQGYLYLQKSERSPDLQPIVGASWGREPSACTLRIRLLLCQECAASDGVEGLGFRLEAPEGPVGRHSFFHAQLIKLERTTPGSPDWLPDKEPTLNVAAHNEVHLVASLAMSLYGATVLNEMATDSSLDIVKEHLRSFASLNGISAMSGASSAQARRRGKKRGRK